jgi:hypothetical protein
MTAIERLGLAECASAVRESGPSERQSQTRKAFGY